MTIQVNNITDFINLIETCISNNIKDVRVFTSEETKCTTQRISKPEELKYDTSFTYVLFTPLYNAIYSDKIKAENYDTIFKDLLLFQKQCNYDFRIQRFKNISFDASKNILKVDSQLDVI